MASSRISFPSSPAASIAAVYRTVTRSRACIHCRVRSPLRTTIIRRSNTTAAAPPSPAAAAAAAIDPKISSIVDEISKLTLLETADLVSTLKTRLNIPDMPIGGFAAAGPSGASGPGSAGGGAGAAAAGEEDSDAPPAAQERTLFSLHLKSFEATAKPKIIKEIKSLLGLSLVESKKFVESAPKMMKEGVPKEECGKIIETMKALGGVVTMD